MAEAQPGTVPGFAVALVRNAALQAAAEAFRVLLPPGNCSGVGQTSGLPVHGVSDSVALLTSKRRARGPAYWQTGGLPHKR